MDNLQDLPIITQHMLNGINLIGGQWLSINADHIVDQHMRQTIDEGQFCYMDGRSLDTVLKAVFLYGKRGYRKADKGLLLKDCKW